MSRGWIGVDLDGTLAQYDGFKGPTVIGAPIPAMVARIHEWLRSGIEVRIFTARVCEDGTVARAEEAADARSAIVVWCRMHIGRELAITNVKDYSMWQLWDDRAVQVLPNTGVAVAEEINDFGNAVAALFDQIEKRDFRDKKGARLDKNEAVKRLCAVLTEVMDRRPQRETH